MQWRNFSKVIDRAKLACKNSGKNIEDDFAEVSKIVEAGATKKKVIDYELSRYACYLIVQNGDPRKEVIEGVITNEEYAEFQNAGYMGLYGGLTEDDIHKRKNLKENEKILDFMEST